MAGNGHRAAGGFEVWAARAWNVFNEGRPFSIVYPAMVLLCCGAAGPGARRLAGPGPRSARSRSRWCSRASRSRCAAARCCGWWPRPASRCSSPGAPRRCCSARWPATSSSPSSSGARSTTTCAPARRGRTSLRFWRLVLTNSDPTSGNALEQVPKFVMTLSAGQPARRGRRPRPRWAGSPRPPAGGGRGHAGLALVRAHAPARATPRGGPPPAADGRIARRVYVIVVDGANRERLWQADTPDDRPPRARGHRVPRRRARLSRPHRRVLLLDAHRRGAGRARHALELRPAPGRARGVGVRRARARGPHGPAGGDRPPARSVRRGRGAVGHLGAAHGEIDRSLCAEGAGWWRRRTPTCSCSSCWPPTSSGHVRGVRNREYLEQIEETDRHVGDFLAFLAERGKLDGATVILMADHGQGRGIGGPRAPRLGREPGAVRGLGGGAPCPAR